MSEPQPVYYVKVACIDLCSECGAQMLDIADLMDGNEPLDCPFMYWCPRCGELSHISGQRFRPMEADAT